MARGKSIRSDASNTPRNDFVVVPGAVTASLAVGKASYEVYKWWYANGAVLIAIDDSKCIDNDAERHAVTLRISNMLAHGIYLDSVELSRPKATEFASFVTRPQRWTEEPSLALPASYGGKVAAHRFVPSEGELRLKLEFICPKSKDFWEQPHGTVLLEINQLQKKKPAKPAATDFLLRRASQVSRDAKEMGH